MADDINSWTKLPYHLELGVLYSVSEIDGECIEILKTIRDKSPRVTTSVFGNVF